MHHHAWGKTCSPKVRLVPTCPFTIFDPRDQEVGEIYVVQERRTTDFEALNFESVGRGVNKLGAINVHSQ